MGKFVDQNDELLGWREAVENLDATASGRSQRPAKILGVLDPDSAIDDCGA
jgi:hypothetical protein